MLKGGLVDDRFSLEEPLGCDRYSEVWRARDPEEWGEVAVRVLPGLETLPHLELLRRLEHRNILSVHHVCHQDGSLCLITELAGGGSFLQHVGSPLSDELQRATFESIIYDLSQALLYLHTRNIIHGEVRPARIFWDGLSPRFQDAATSHALWQLRPAIISFAAPEIFDGCVTPKADIYALGVTIYQVLTGVLPFTGTDREIMQGHLNLPVPIPSGMASLWRMLIEGCMEKDPSKRWDAGALIRRLEPHYLEEPEGSLIPVASGPISGIGEVRLQSGSVVHLHTLNVAWWKNNSKR